MNRRTFLTRVAQTSAAVVAAPLIPLAASPAVDYYRMAGDNPLTPDDCYFADDWPLTAQESFRKWLLDHSQPPDVSL